MERLGLRPDAPEQYVGPRRFASYYRDYLHHGTYREYSQIRETSSSDVGVRRLEAMAKRLSREEDPILLSAAASAYLESGISQGELDVTGKLTLAGKAQMLWGQALQNEATLTDTDGTECDTQYRIAMNLACLPIVKSMFRGDVKEGVIDTTIDRLISIGDACGAEETSHRIGNDVYSANMLVGVQHELNALVSLLYKKDARYVVLPSFQREGTGFYNPEQTHDINLISQHFGNVRSILPIEVKARISQESRERYEALLVGGRVHLGVNGSIHQRNPSLTRHAMARHRAGEATEDDEQTVLSIQRTMSKLLSDYKKTGKRKPLAQTRRPEASTEQAA